MPPITPDQLPQEIQDILGTEADPFATIGEQPVCTPDARVTAQAIGEKRPPRVKPARIANAQKGDLILTPGGPEGPVGALLTALQPTQFYSHMGIMVRDYTHVRHATFSEERLQKYPHTLGQAYGGVLSPEAEFFPARLGTDVPPTDGFQPTALQEGWPGTLTQSVHVCWMNWQYSGLKLDDLPPHLHPLRFLWEQAEAGMEAKPLEDRLILRDAVMEDREDNAFKIGAITLGDVQFLPRSGLPDGQVAPCLVVKPCDELDSKSVRDALHRIADAVSEIRGHYRFFSYTQAGIAFDPAKRGLETMLETTMPDPADPCLGRKREGGIVGGTWPVVCSTVIWAAVQQLNNQATAKGLPRIVLDGRGGQGRQAEQARVCQRPPYFPPPAVPDIVGPTTPDGLYEYDEENRKQAGKALYDQNHARVEQIILDSSDLLAFVKNEAAKSDEVSGLLSILKVAAVVGMPVAAALWGLTDDILAELITLLTDLPDDVANQLCNSFANDDASTDAKDSTAWWDAPGSGTTVSPDNIMRSWSPPISQSQELIVGLYGHNEPARVMPPDWWPNPPPQCVWEISQGQVEVRIRVILPKSITGGAEVGAEGAHVRIGGVASFRTGKDGYYQGPMLPEGVYWADARLDHIGSGFFLESNGEVVRLGASSVIIELQAPPAGRRRVSFRGSALLVNRHAGAEIPLLDQLVKDWEKTRAVDARAIPDAYLDVNSFGFPDRPEFTALRNSMQETQRELWLRIEDWGSALVRFTLTLQPNRSVKLRCQGAMVTTGDPDWAFDDTYAVAEDGTVPLQIRIEKGLWPARATVDLVVSNARV